MDNAHDFYRDPRVLGRIFEYCGVPENLTKNFSHEPNVRELANSGNIRKFVDQMTAEYVVGVGNWVKEYKHKSKATSRKPEGLGELLDKDSNLFRSVWDKKGVVFFLDVEYTSGKFPGEAYANPERVFDLLEPVYLTIFNVLKESGIEPLTLATGQGYHFVFRVNSFDSDGKVAPLARKMTEVGHIEDTLQGKYLHISPQEKRPRVLSPELGRAFDTSGKLLELVVHDIIKNAERYGVRLPLGVGDLNPGNNMQEGINLDLSTYADPLHTRVMRTAFSIHDKNRSDESTRHIPIQIEIPRHTPCNGHTLNLEEIHKNRRNFEHSANYAGAITTSIPECSAGVAILLEKYLHSSLYKFHADFDSTREEDPSNWGKTYDRFDLNQLPPCVADAIRNPNPSLLQPRHLQTITRVLTGKVWWHPKHVTGLIRSKYERAAYGWRYNWSKYDANTHACVWTRMYGGMLATGIDLRVDQNCVSHQERGLCTGPNCGYNIAKYR